MSRYKALLRALQRVGDGPGIDLGAALRNLPEVGELPSPWETWTLVGLVRHRRRQLWVADIINHRLGASLLDLARRGSLGHPPERPQQGPVPGLPEWEYYFHGRGCCLTHKVTGESIDVDFFDDSAEYFDVFFYGTYLKSLRAPDPVERRLLDLHASVDAVRIAVQDLGKSGLLQPLPGREAHPYRLSEWVLQYEEIIDDCCRRWEDPNQKVWLAALIGDWPAVHELARGSELSDLEPLSGGRSQRCRELRRQRLVLALNEDHLASAALHGLADLGPDAADPVLKVVLQGPIAGGIYTALQIVEERDDPAWCVLVYGLFRRLRLDGEYPQAHQWLTCLRFLLRHRFRTERLVPELSKATGYGEACLLALEHAPDLALPLFRSSLRSPIPASRCTAAAILSLIDQPWCRDELMSVLRDSRDQDLTADSRAALLESRDTDAHRVAREWEVENPHEPEAPSYLEIDGKPHGPFYSMREHMLRGRQQWLRHEMQTLHDRVLPLRDRVPPPNAPCRPWWKRWGQT